MTMAMEAIKKGVKQMAQEVTESKDADEAITLLETLDNLLGRFGNMSEVTPKQFTDIAMSKA